MHIRKNGGKALMPHRQIILITFFVKMITFSRIFCIHPFAQCPLSDPADATLITYCAALRR